jgi:hypothetical protein
MSRPIMVAKSNDQSPSEKSLLGIGRGASIMKFSFRWGAI